MQSASVKYENNTVNIQSLPQKNADLQVFVHPTDQIIFPKDIPDATYQLMGGDIVMNIPGGGTITFVSMGLVAFVENTLKINFPSASFTLEKLLSQVDDVKEAPVESLVTDEFVKLEQEFSQNKEQKPEEENQNFSKILQDIAPQALKTETQKEEMPESRPQEEAPTNNFNALYKPTDDNPMNVNISAVNNAVEAGLKFTLTAYQTAKSETKDVNDNVVAVAGGSGSDYGSRVDTPEAQFQAETLDYRQNADTSVNTTAMVIHTDDPKLFKTDPNDLASEGQLSRDLSIKPEQPIGFGISDISISNLPDGFKILGATYTAEGIWEVPKAVYDANGNLVSDGFTIDINTGKARFTMLYPEDLLEGEEITAVINFVSTFDSANLLPGESVDTPDVTQLSGQGRLFFVTKTIDWESPTGYEDFIDNDERVVLATNPNNNILFTSYGDNTVYGGAGKDTVTSYDGNDTISAAGGDDTISSGAGDDTLYGEEGDDLLSAESGTNVIDGGEGLDSVSYAFVTDNGGVSVDLSLSTASSAGVTDTIVNVERVLGSSKNDFISGDNLANILEGNEGDDTLVGLDGADTLIGGLGNDTLEGSAGNDELSGGIGDDSLLGGLGDDILNGEGGNDTLFWDEGSDTLDGGLGSDVMDFSTFIGGVVASIYQGDVTISNDSSGVDVITNVEILSGSADADELVGGSDDNTLLGQGGADTLRGNEGNDLLDGGSGNDTLKGGADIDTLYGGDGDDLLLGEAGADKIDGQTGIDTADYSDEGAIHTTLNEGTFVAVNVSGGDSDQIRNVENIKGSNTGDDQIGGDALVNVLDGQGGDDTLSGADGNDTLLGDAGDDTLRGELGDDTLIGGSGSDTADYTNEGKVVVDLSIVDGNGNNTVTIINGALTEIDKLLDIENITGSDTKDDEIAGNDDANILKGLDGNDTLQGRGGDDQLDGGLGNDSLFGGADQDTLKGSYGDDYLEGGAGNDILEGGAGIDTISFVNASNAVNVHLDTGVATGEGVDSILDVENVVGSGFADSLTGNDTANVFYAGDGNDTLLGGLGNDTLYGENGDDTLSGGRGEDKLYGGDGLVDTSTQDMASYLDVNSGVGITVDMNKDNSVGNAKVSNDGYNSVDYLYEIENVQGSNYQDFIKGDSNTNYLLGEAARDTLYGGDGNDTVDGGSQDDTLRGEAGDDTLIGGDGLDMADYSAATNGIKVDLQNYDGLGFNVSDDGQSGKDRLVDVENIIGSTSVDTIVGDTQNNVFEGGESNDTLKGGSGLDTLYGDAGDDTFFGGADTDYIDGGSKSGDTGDLNDMVDYSDVTANGVNVNLSTNSATGDGNDQIFNIENIRGSSQDDTLTGDTGVNTIFGGAGADIVAGGEGIDTLYGEAGDDTLRGDQGDDILYGGDGITDTGSDTADYSTVSNGTLTGIDADLSRAGAQIVEDGYGGADTLYGVENVAGTNYDDLIKGSDDVSELNVLSGNGGDDSFVSSDGQDSIVGGAGVDTIDYSTLSNGSSTGLALDFDVLGEEKSITKTTVNATFVDLVKTVEIVIGTQYADSFVGGSGDDQFYGQDGDDTFVGNSGADTLVGEAGNDLLSGDSGDDTLEGGTGDDTFIGGTGNDLLDGGTNTGDRDVADYTSAATKIELDLENNQVIGADSGVDTIQNIEVLLATNYEDTLVGDDAKNVIDGRGANDTIVGKGGDDTLIGYNGADTLNGGLGSDLLIGGSDANDKDTVGFNEIVVGGSAIGDLNSIVNVDLEGNNAAIVSIDRTDTTAVVSYSFDINGTTITYTAQDGDTGDDVISQLYDAMVAAGLTDIKQLNDISNEPNIDTYHTSHRLLIMDTSTAQSGFVIDNVVALISTQAGTAESVNTITANTEIDYLFDFDNIVGSDISAGGVGDTLEGNSANNTILAGDGDDTIFSTAGVDLLDGQAGDNDWIDYSKSTNRVDLTMDAGNGDGTGTDNFNNTIQNIENVRGTDAVAGDTIIGDANNNIIEGGDNNNNSDANNDNRDSLYGGDGNDTLYGQGGRDILSGGAGADTLYGGDQSDTLYGGNNADTFDGGAGYDIVDYYNTAILLDLANMSRTDAQGDDVTSAFTSIEEIYGSDGADEIIVIDDMNISSRNGNDILIGGSLTSRINAGEGNDLIDGGAGDDILNGGRQNDTFFANSGSDTIDGGENTDTIDFRDDRTYTSLDSSTQTIGVNVTEGIAVDLRETVNIGGTNYGTISNNGFGESGYIRAVENIEATNFDDIFIGNSTKNIVNLYAGDDTVFLSDGADTIDGGSNDALSAGGGDWIDASNITSGGAIYLNTGYEYMGTPGGRVTNFEHIKASAYNDYMLQGDAQDNSILGMAGDDTLIGNGGDDYLDGGDNNDTVTYGDFSAGSPSGVAVHFDTATKTVNDGFGGVDTLVNIETVIGSTHNDTFYGSSSNDTFLSGGGQDSFISSLGDDFLSGNEGGVAASLVDYSNVASGNKLILDMDAANDQAQLVALSDSSKYFTDQLQDLKNVIATNENDTLTGSSADNSIYGRGGDDIFIATDGNDTYDGGASAAGDWVDYSAASTQIVSDLKVGSTSKGINGSSDGLNSIEHIKTGSGNDTITASSADNTIIANSGNDTIYSNDGDNVFYGDDSTDTATNDGVQDTIRYDLEDTGSGVSVNLANETATNAYGKTDTLYNFENVIGSANGDIIVGNSLSNSILGGAGADTITGGAGSDILLGAAGDDKFIFTNAEFGADTSVGGGDDTDAIEITDAAAVSDSDFSNISMMEKIVLSSNNAHTLTLGTNANTAGIKEIDATAALSSSVTLNVSSMSNDLKIDTSNAADSVVLSGGADTLHTYNGNDTIEYDSAAKVDNGLLKPSDTIDAGAGTDTLFANSAEDYDLSNASISSVETLKFYQGGADQSIVISGDQNLEMTTFEGNAAQNNTLQVENTVSANNVDLSTGKTLTNIENTIINSNYNINSTLIGNSATKDTITGSAADDVLSGLGSDDILNAGGGDDTIKDGSGIDTIDAGAGDDTIEFSVANLDASDGNDTISGGADNDTLVIGTAVTHALTDTLLTNVTEIETIALANVVNAIKLDQNGVKLQGGTNTDTYTYDQADFDANDTLDGSNGTDELILDSSVGDATKDLSDFANVSNIEKLTLTSGADNLDLTGGANGFNTIALGSGDDTLTIDANNLWGGKTLDGGIGTDTLSLDGNVDLSNTTVMNFEAIGSSGDLSLTVEQINDLGVINIGTNVLNVVGNGADNSFSATNITASKLTFSSGMSLPTTVNDLHMDLDASASNQSIIMNVGAATSKNLDIKGSNGGADELNMVLANSEAITSALSVNGAVESFNLTLTDSDHSLDLSNVTTDLTLLSGSATGARVVSISNATSDIDASDLSANESLSVTATASAINIAGGASSSDTIIFGSGSTIGSVNNIEIFNVTSDLSLAGKVSSSITDVNITASKTLTLAASDLNANSFNIDNGTTSFIAGSAGANDFSGITISNGAVLLMSVNAHLDNTSSSDDFNIVDQINVASGITLSVNADQIDDNLAIDLGSSTSHLVITSTTTDTNDFSSLSKTGSGDITYNVAHNLNKTSLADDIFGPITILDIDNTKTLQVNNAQLATIDTLNGAGTLDVVGDGSVDLSSLSGTFSGDVFISDVTSAETIIASAFDDTITIDAGAGDSVIAGAGDDTINISQSLELLDGGANNDTLVVTSGTIDLSSKTITSIETLTIQAGATLTITDDQASAIGTINGTGTIEIVIDGDSNIDLSGITTTTKLVHITADTNFTGTFPIGATISVADGATLSANYDKLNGFTINKDVNSGAVLIKIPSADSSADLSTITGSADKTAEFTQTQTFTGDLSSVTATIVDGAVVTSGASHVVGETINVETSGVGTDGVLNVTVADVVGENDADLSSINGNALQSITITQTMTFTGTLHNTVATTVANGAVLTIADTIVNGKTVNGSGSVTVTVGGNSSIDLTSIDVSGVESVEFTADTTFSGNLADTDRIIISGATTDVTMASGVISGKTLSLSGDGVLNVNASGTTDLSGLSGSFSGTLNILPSNSGANTITGSGFNENFIYSSDAQADTIDGGLGNNAIIINANVDLRAITGVNLTNINTLSVSGDFTATVDKDFVENSSITTYTGNGGVSDFIKVDLGDGESIDLTSLTFGDLKVKIDVAGGGGASTIVGNDEVANIITLVDGTNTITTFTQDDTITGGSGVDTINLGSGNDVVDAGSNNDIIKIAAGSLTSSDMIEGGAGNDTIEYTTSSTTAIDASDFDNVTNVQTLKLSDGNNTMNFSTNAGSISIVDGANITSGSHLNITAGSQLTHIIGGADNDTITFADADLSSADTIEGAGGSDTLVISDAANIAASDLLNVTNVEVLQLSNNVNDVDLTSSSIASIIGGSGVDTITAEGDELSITTLGGNDVVKISSVPVGTLDGGANSDRLEVTGDLDLSLADIISFETIVTNDSITLSAAQADGVTMQIASGKTLTVTGAGTTLNLSNVTRADNTAQIVIGNSLTTAVAITALGVDLVASSANQDLSITTTNAALNITGSSTNNTTVEYTANTTLTGSVIDVDTIIANSGLTVDATLLDGKTQEFSTTGTITINATTTAGDHDFANITQIGSGNVVLNVDNSVDLSGQNVDVIDTFDVASGQTLTLDSDHVGASDVFVGDGDIVVNATNSTSTIDLSGVDVSGLNGSVTINDGSGSNTITATAKADIINLTGGDDIVNGGDGDDTINIANDDFDSNDEIDGGYGTDSIVFSNAMSKDYESDFAHVSNVENFVGSSLADSFTLDFTSIATMQTKFDGASGSDTVLIEATSLNLASDTSLTQSVFDNIETIDFNALTFDGASSDIVLDTDTLKSWGNGTNEITIDISDNTQGTHFSIFDSTNATTTNTEVTTGTDYVVDGLTLHVV